MHIIPQYGLKSRMSGNRHCEINETPHFSKYQIIPIFAVELIFSNKLKNIGLVPYLQRARPIVILGDVVRYSQEADLLIT